MNEQECLNRMIAPGTPRPGKWRRGVIQVRVIRSCDLGCFGCTQASQIAGPKESMSIEHFEQALISLKGYFGVVGVFGGNPALHPEFEDICKLMQKHVPFQQRGIWCNHPRGKGKLMRETFNPAHSNLNVHMSQQAYDEFKRDWPESNPVGLQTPSRHSPVHGSMVDLGVPESERWTRIANCDINQHWSAIIATVGDNIYAFACEIMASQAFLRRDEPGFQHHGMAVEPGWWQKPMQAFADQVRAHCHHCLVPMRGKGELDVAGNVGLDQTTKLYALSFKPKKALHSTQVIESVDQLQPDYLRTTVDYIGNAKK